jgi:hypothetical protein
VLCKQPARIIHHHNDITCCVGVEKNPNPKPLSITIPAGAVEYFFQIEEEATFVCFLRERISVLAAK